MAAAAAPASAPFDAVRGSFVGFAPGAARLTAAFAFLLSPFAFMIVCQIEHTPEKRWNVPFQEDGVETQTRNGVYIDKIPHKRSSRTFAGAGMLSTCSRWEP